MQGVGPFLLRGPAMLLGKLVRTRGLRVVTTRTKELRERPVKLGEALVYPRCLCVCGESPLRDEIHGGFDNQAVTSPNAS